MSEYVLKMEHIKKEFSGVTVLNDVNFCVKRGEILALCGENGAGKSTLMKILSGVYPYGEYTGEIILEGQVQKFAGIKDSTKAGIEIIFQELEIIPNMTVAENIFLGNEPIKHGVVDKNYMINQSQKVLDELKINIHPDTLVESLGVGMKQMVAIAKSLNKNPKILLLDEPSAALTETETDNLLRILGSLRKKGVSCVYISHRLDEVMQIADTITVLRDGTTICTEKRMDMDKPKLIRHMVGRELSDQFIKDKVEIGEKVLEVQGLTVTDKISNKPIISNISFELHRGEIFSLVGLMGAGRTETAMAIMGQLPGRVSGRVLLKGRAIRNRTPEQAIEDGVAIVVEDRKEKGLILDMDIKNNVVLSSLKKISNKIGIVDENLIIKTTNDYRKSLEIKADSIEMKVMSLSGGNQQKVVLAKALMTKPEVLILDEPTRGIDVGAKHEIYTLINNLVNEGLSVLMITSELPEAIAMSDRIAVMADGEIRGILDKSDFSQEVIMHYATMEGE